MRKKWQHTRGEWNKTASDKKTKRVPFREVAVGGDGDLALVPSDSNGIAECTGLAANLNPLLKELLQRSNVHNFILHRLRAIDHKARSLLLPLRSAHFRASLSLSLLGAMVMISCSSVKEQRHQYKLGFLSLKRQKHLPFYYKPVPNYLGRKYFVLGRDPTKQAQ